MRLYIVRHAIAVAQGTPGFEADKRPLTEEGIEKMRRAAKGLRKLAVHPHTILCSPLPRALQTAEILLEELGGQAVIKLTDALAPSAIAGRCTFSCRRCAHSSRSCWSDISLRSAKSSVTSPGVRLKIMWS